MSTGVMVAGASGALGVAVVETLLEAGHEVTACYSSPRGGERLEAAFADAPAARLVEADLTEPEGAERATAATADLGAVVNLVGGYAGGAKVHETDPEVLDRMLRLNLRSGFLLARAAVPRLLSRGGGAFVVVGARNAVRPAAGSAAYNVSKAALLALVGSLDAEYRADGLRANAVLPSTIDTEANRAAMPSADHAGWVAPAEIASVIAFLVSGASAATTGAAIPVYGRA